MDNDPVRDGLARIEAALNERVPREGWRWECRTYRWLGAVFAEAKCGFSKIEAGGHGNSDEALHDLARILGVTL